MKDNEEVTDVLNDLIRINYDRIEGYKRAGEELKDGDAELHSLFSRFITESSQNLNDLTRLVRQYGGDEASGTTASGKIYRAWMDVKAVFTGHDKKTVLENCEFGEDAAQKAYRSALEDDDNELPSDVISLISQQKMLLKASHDLVRSLRDRVSMSSH